jgi:hypothetical protein
MLNLLGRAYVAFSLVAVGTGMAAAWAGGDHLLHSDDPYLVGFFLGGVAATLTVIYLGLKWFPAPSASKHAAEIVYFGGLLLWAVVWLAVDYNAVEGKGIGMLIAVASAVTGITVWPLCRFQLPTVAARVIGLLGAAFIGGYAYVAFQMAQRMN